jgi:hypothetical protein
MSTIHWIATVLAAALMTLASVPDIFQTAGAVSIFRHLGYPVAKALGVVVILLPRMPRLK